MTITIRHHTTYRFDAPVFLEPHVIRLHPRTGAAARLVDFALDIEPAPAVRAENLDLDGNAVTHAWFEGWTDKLEVRSRATVETLIVDPFRFLAVGGDRSLPYAYPPDLAHRLRPCRSAPDAAHRSVRELAADVARESAHSPLAFPLDLARRLHEEFTLHRRPDGPPLPPHETAAHRRGACRDLAVLFIECCRAMGLAARFASGYAHTDSGTPNELHAWAEVYLIGGGWRAFDPSYGVAVADRHVTVAAAPEARDAAPITGTFRGDAASRLRVAVDVRDAPTTATTRAGRESRRPRQ
ncbi:MAG: transglutaminase family protein [Acidobacteria bacterium]|nr:transglutaminase family protein [Acidobacteriota bacterium]